MTCKSKWTFFEGEEASLEKTTGDRKINLTNFPKKKKKIANTVNSLYCAELILDSQVHTL